MTVFDSVCQAEHLDGIQPDRPFSRNLCVFSFVSFSCFPPDRMSPEERRPNDNTAKLFQMKWSILGYFLGEQIKRYWPYTMTETTRFKRFSAEKWSPLCINTNFCLQIHGDWLLYCLPQPQNSNPPRKEISVFESWDHEKASIVLVKKVVNDLREKPLGGTTPTMFWWLAGGCSQIHPELDRHTKKKRWLRDSETLCQNSLPGCFNCL